MHTAELDDARATPVAPVWAARGKDKPFHFNFTGRPVRAAVFKQLSETMWCSTVDGFGEVRECWDPTAKQENYCLGANSR